MSLGEYGKPGAVIVGLAEAREKAHEARKLLASDVDPMAERKADKQAVEAEQEAEQRKAKLAFEMSPGNGIECGKSSLSKAAKNRSVTLILFWTV